MVHWRILGLIQEKTGPGDGSMVQHASQAVVGWACLRKDVPLCRRSSRYFAGGAAHKGTKARELRRRGCVSRQCHSAVRWEALIQSPGGQQQFGVL